MKTLNLPNAISASRVPLAAAFIASESRPARVGIAIAAGLSDFIDGKLARGLGKETRAGALLDPLTDRAFVLGALSSFVASGELSGRELVALLGRDIYTTLAFGGAAALRLPVRFRSRYSGKVVTSLQVATILALLLRPRWTRALVAMTLVASVYAIVDYTRAGLDDLRAGEALP